MGFDLQPNDEQVALKTTLNEFSSEVVRPAARACESDRRVPADLLARIHEIGVVAPVDESYGGGGLLDPITYCIAVEELAWGDPGIAFQAIGSGLAAIVIGLAGSEEQKTQYLPSFAERHTPSFVALGEKIAVGDLQSLETTVDGDKVSGEKYGVLDADEATLGIVVGRSDEGLGAAIVDKETDWEIVRPEAKLGLEAARTSVVRFNGTGHTMPPSPELTKALLWTKLSVGALAVGCARASLEHAAQYATEREAFGKPIGAFQGISFKIADMAIEVDAARLALWDAAWKVDRGEATVEDVAQGVGQALAAAILCGDDGVQVLGGHGYIRDHPVEKWFRDAVTLSVFDSPDLVGDALIGGGR